MPAKKKTAKKVASNKNKFSVSQGEAMLKRIDQAIAAREKESRVGTKARAIRLVAEGDSWFDFKIAPDVIDWLRKDHSYDIVNIAKGGACIYEMAYGPDNDSIFDIFGRDASQLEEVVKKIREHQPQAFLFSAGGNDFVGPEFILTIRHALAKKSGVNAPLVDALFREDVEPGFRLVIETVIAATRQQGLGDIPVILHGYDYVFPDGRAALNLGIKKIGPWMHPSFELKGYAYKKKSDLDLRRKIVGTMIDTIYEMLHRLKADYPNIHIVDVRGTLPSPSEWNDELHPTAAGFRKVASRFNEVIKRALR